MNYKCENCGEVWDPCETTKDPKTCPGCKSHYSLYDAGHQVHAEMEALKESL